MEDLADKWNNFSLLDRENTGFVCSSKGPTIRRVHNRGIVFDSTLLEHGDSGKDVEATVEVHRGFQDPKSERSQSSLHL